MKLTSGLIDKLIRLRDGEAIPSSHLKGEWVDDFLRDRIIISTSNGSRKSYRISNRECFIAALERINEGLADLDKMRIFLTTSHTSGNASRATQARETGNSKLKISRSFPGFLVNTYESIDCELNGTPFILNPSDGLSCFIFDWKSFKIPESTIVVGIENPENFRHIRKQRTLFEGLYPGNTLLFVSRYPQSKDLRHWLELIDNQYVHFGDFDLAGIKIFITEFQRYLPKRSSFLIPADIEERLRKFGSRERFNGNYYENRNIHCDIPKVQHLIELILKYHKCYDQEGYIGYDNQTMMQTHLTD